MSRPNPLRPDKRLDLTRWNRAGLTRFDYVDGDAAVWLEELRIACMGLTARGVDIPDRLPEHWRDLFMEQTGNWPGADARADFEASLAWKALFAEFPDRPETGARRNARLLAQYSGARGDYGWEILRAFARAVHVLLGHQNAYANEGYLRTATQWDNLRKLAAMVNHQPAPPSSAITTIGLMVETGAEPVEIARGLAMKYAPPEGGAPVIFETLAEIRSHSDLNALRTEDWDRDPTPLSFAGDRWIAGEDSSLSPGGLGIVESLGASPQRHAIRLVQVDVDPETGIAELGLSPTASLARGDAVLNVAPKDVRRALPRSTTGILVLRIETAANYSVNSIVRLHFGTSGTLELRVDGHAAGHLKLDVSGKSVSGLSDGDPVTVETLVPVASSGSSFVLPEMFGTTIYYVGADHGVHSHVGKLLDYQGNEVESAIGGFEIMAKAAGPGELTSAAADKLNLGVQYGAISGNVGTAYAPAAASKTESAIVVMDPPEVLPEDYRPRRIVSFAGKPPKGLAIGDLMVMRDPENDALTALLVVGVAQGTEQYSLQFDVNLTGNLAAFEPDAREFHGPLLESLRPLDWDRNPQAAFSGASFLADALSDAARDLLRPGRACLIEDERGIEAPVLAEIKEAVDLAGGAAAAKPKPLDDFLKAKAKGAAIPEAHSGKMLTVKAAKAGGKSGPDSLAAGGGGASSGGTKVILTASDGLSGFLKGWTTINLNAVQASHGETKGPKTLGSGDGERLRQSFRLAAQKVSFVPSSVAETGVAPDLDVAVDGVLWSYSDLIDPLADGTETYSTAVNEDGSLTVHFRRRLPTGTDNLVVRRHRTGVGPEGMVPARAFTKPMKKNRFVGAITQPLAATGGAEREPVEDIRVNAPARLAANDRAVSLEDFARLARRRSDVWQAHARQVTLPTSPHDVILTIVPANGGLVGATQALDLIDFIEARALPGTRVGIEDFGAIRLRLGTTIYVDTERYDKTEVQQAAHAELVASFRLDRRGLGQPVYVAEVIAALERVVGVETATIQGFALKSGGPAIRRSSTTGGVVSALFPFETQVIFLDEATAGTDATIAVEKVE